MRAGVSTVLASLLALTTTANTSSWRLGLPEQLARGSVWFSEWTERTGRVFTTLALSDADTLLLGSHKGHVYSLPLSQFERGELNPYTLPDLDKFRYRLPSADRHSAVRKLVPLSRCALAVLSDALAIIVDRCAPDSWIERHVIYAPPPRAGTLSNGQKISKSTPWNIGVINQDSFVLLNLIDLSLVMIRPDIHPLNESFSGVHSSRFAVQIDPKIRLSQWSEITGMSGMTDGSLLISLDGTQLCILTRESHPSQSYRLRLLHDYSPMPIGELSTLPVISSNLGTQIELLTESGLISKPLSSDQHFSLLTEELFNEAPVIQRMAGLVLREKDDSMQGQSNEPSSLMLAALTSDILSTETGYSAQSVLLTIVPLIPASETGNSLMMPRKRRMLGFSLPRWFHSRVHPTSSRRATVDVSGVQEMIKGESTAFHTRSTTTTMTIRTSSAAVSTIAEKIRRRQSADSPDISLSRIWIKQGCKEGGAWYPNGDEHPLKKHLKYLTVMGVERLFSDLAASAKEGNAFAKLACISARICEMSIHSMEGLKSLHCLLDKELISFLDSKILGKGGQGLVVTANRLKTTELIRKNNHNMGLDWATEKIVIKIIPNNHKGLKSFLHECTGLMMFQSSNNNNNDQNIQEESNGDSNTIITPVMVNVPKLIAATNQELLPSSSEIKLITKNKKRANYLIIATEYLSNSMDLPHFIQKYLDHYSSALLFANVTDIALQLMLDVITVLHEFDRLKATHCDVKPPNILVVLRKRYLNNSEKKSLIWPRFYLIDFGLTWVRSIDQLGSPLLKKVEKSSLDTHMQGGTLAFMSPEQAAIGGRIGNAEDQAEMERRCYVMDLYGLMLTVNDMYARMCRRSTVNDSENGDGGTGLFCESAQKMINLPQMKKTKVDDLPRLWEARHSICEDFMNSSSEIDTNEEETKDDQNLKMNSMRFKDEQLGILVCSVIVRAKTDQGMWYSEPCCPIRTEQILKRVRELLVYS